MSKDKVMLIVITLSLICVFIGSFEVVEFTNPKTNTYISKLGYSLLVINFSTLFWHKNTVQYNKKGVVIRIKSFFGKSVKFSEVKHIELKDNVFNIVKIYGEPIYINISLIDKTDVNRLLQIFKTNEAL